MKRRSFGRDRGLSLRMLATGAMLGLLYVVFAVVLFNVLNVGLAPMLLIVIGLAAFQYWTSDRLAHAEPRVVIRADRAALDQIVIPASTRAVVTIEASPPGRDDVHALADVVRRHAPDARARSTYVATASAVDPDATNDEVVTGDTWGGGSIVFVDKAAVNQDACQGATVTVHYVSN